jgi:hypothetical protein
MQTLDEIAIKYRTDKSSLVHDYANRYEQHLDSYRQLPIRILEIGVQSGASLRMWKEYFPNAQIYGYDYYDCDPFEEDRVTLFRGAQMDTKALEKVGQTGAFDIIIDDGSHKNADIMNCFKYFFPRLAPRGLYVIEDMNVCYWGDTHNVGAPIVIERMKDLVDDVMARGKSGIGDPKKDQKDGEYKIRGEGKMTWWEKNVESVHFYRSMAFIYRNDLTY